MFINVAVDSLSRLTLDFDLIREKLRRMKSLQGKANICGQKVTRQSLQGKKRNSKTQVVF